MEHLRRGDADAAAVLLREVLEADPLQPDAWQLTALLQHRSGDSGAAAESLRRAIALLDPGHPAAAGFHNNLGNVLLESGRAGDAEAAYRRGIELAPRAAPTWLNLSVVLRQQDRLQEAADAARQAVQLDAGLAEAWYALARLLIELGRVPEGLVAHSEAVLLAPRATAEREQVLRALVLLGRTGEAAAVLRDWLAQEPDNPVALHQLAACAGAQAPARASDAYVQAVFDSIAPAFDARLAALGYRAPECIETAVSTCAGEPRAALDVADLGCGTGLAGVRLRPWARRLVGCDLSEAMLRQAQQRRVYDELRHAELVQFLAGSTGAFDLVACTDTLCYLGDLRPFALAAAAALRPGGMLAVTTEVLDSNTEAGWALQTSGRYAHHNGYLVGIFGAAGLLPRVVRRDTLRQEAGRPVEGWVVVARRPG
jgi:predicted TPR repeat methyltransferase